MSDFMEHPILKCHECGERLNEFEEGKFHKLEDYLQGRRVVYPRCVSCYNLVLDKKRAKYEK